MKRLILFFTLFYQITFAQTVDKLTLEDCYRMAQESFPLLKQKGLIQSSNALNINTLEKNYLPQIEFGAQATYQSEVTAFNLDLPIPGFKAPTPLSKDQYKATLDIKQIIWDGGVINMQKKVLNASAEVENQKIEVELSKLKERVNQLYFNILQIDENIKLIDILKLDLAARIKKAAGGIANGVVLKRDMQTFQVEDLKADQRIIELKSMRSAAIQMLSLLLNKVIDEKTTFERPQLRGVTDITKIDRPEVTLFTLQKKLFDQQSKITALKNFPRLQAFGTLGYGRPGLNFLKNEFSPYALGGIAFKWNISDLYAKTVKNDLQILNNNAQVVDIQRDIFLLNTNITTKQQNAEIEKIEKLLQTDRQIVVLREKIKQTAAVQLDNGTITTNDFIIDLNAENQARLNLAIHELQLLNAVINLQTTIGK
jgi:outer membrane protein TolC